MSPLGFIFKKIELFWKNIRIFAFENKTIFKIFFIFLYTAEQAILIWLTYTAINAQELGLVISVFSLIVLTTFSLHKLLMESRIKFLENQVVEINVDKRMLEEENKAIKVSHARLLSNVEELIFDVSKNLNPKTFYDKNEKRSVKYENK